MGSQRVRHNLVTEQQQQQRLSSRVFSNIPGLYPLNTTVLCLVTQSCSTLCNPMDCSPSGSSVYGNSLGKKTRVCCHALLRGSSQPRDWTQVSTLQANSLSSEPPRKPKKTGMCSLSLLQEIFPTQESTQGILHCRWIIYQLSNQGSPLPPSYDSQKLLKISPSICRWVCEITT